MLKQQDVNVKILAVYESNTFNPANFSCNLELSSVIDGERRSVKATYSDLVGLRIVSSELLPNLLISSALTKEQSKYLSQCVHNAFTEKKWNENMDFVSIEFDPYKVW
jgi:hypothetical protein